MRPLKKSKAAENLLLKGQHSEGECSLETRKPYLTKLRLSTMRLSITPVTVSFPILEEPVEPLKQLFSYEIEELRQFLNWIRVYNSCFHMTSFGAKKVVAMPGFSQKFTIQVQVYHRIGSLLLVSNMQLQFLQFYLMGDKEAETERHKSRDDTKLQQVGPLHDNNHFISELKTALENMPNEPMKVAQLSLGMFY
ncbi:hypothetical protein PR048_025349 [Dryococelus australis]|uniref:Uncharacterized protein n=1 Tax=Dryococelus australis TaxID=614101 RepID=A0ABQ9GR27_9NEOP|nr:hypothetical protein PR048_025349 [Dryococelus australis]